MTNKRSITLNFRLLCKMKTLENLHGPRLMPGIRNFIPCYRMLWPAILGFGLVASSIAEEVSSASANATNGFHNHPPVKPARRNPPTRYGQFRINRHNKPLR